MKAGIEDRVDGPQGDHANAPLCCKPHPSPLMPSTIPIPSLCLKKCLSSPLPQTLPIVSYALNHTYSSLGHKLHLFFLIPQTIPILPYTPKLFLRYPLLSQDHTYFPSCPIPYHTYPRLRTTPSVRHFRREENVRISTIQKKKKSIASALHG